MQCGRRATPRAAGGQKTLLSRRGDEMPLCKRLQCDRRPGAWRRALKRLALACRALVAARKRRRATEAPRDGGLLANLFLYDFRHGAPAGVACESRPSLRALAAMPAMPAATVVAAMRSLSNVQTFWELDGGRRLQASMRVPPHATPCADTFDNNAELSTVRVPLVKAVLRVCTNGAPVSMAVV